MKSTDSSTDAQAKLASPADEFYVGYLPMPKGHRRLVTHIVIAMTMWCVAIAFILSMTMRDPGSATWNTNTIKQWTGTLWQSPYPHLVFDSPKENNGHQSILVVAMGKHGAQDLLKDHFGTRVTLSGYELIRDGRHLIELDEDENAIVRLAQDSNPEPSHPSTLTASTSPIPESLIGEIVDGKCYLGAMKPGDGMGHRACATLCLNGGLPPMFVAQSESGVPMFYLLIVDGSTTLTQEVLRVVACPVEIVGTTGQVHGLPTFQTTAAQIRPLESIASLEATP